MTILDFIMFLLAVAFLWLLFPWLGSKVGRIIHYTDGLGFRKFLRKL